MNGKARYSVRTVRSVLIKNNLNGRVAARKPYLTAAHKLHWAKAHKDWKEEEWRRVILSDETSVQLLQRGGQEEVLSSATTREIPTQLPPHCQTRWG